MKGGGRSDNGRIISHGHYKRTRGDAGQLHGSEACWCDRHGCVLACGSCCGNIRFDRLQVRNYLTTTVLEYAWTTQVGAMKLAYSVCLLCSIYTFVENRLPPFHPRITVERSGITISPSGWQPFGIQKFPRTEVIILTDR